MTKAWYTHDQGTVHMCVLYQGPGTLMTWDTYDPSTVPYWKSENKTS